MPAGLPRFTGKMLLLVPAALIAAVAGLALVRDQEPRSEAVPASEGAGTIAYVGGADGNYEIYTIAPDGTGRLRLTHDAGEDLFPAWSRDGSRIAFASDRSGDFDIFTMAPNGTDLKRLTYDESRETDPVWSPDGKALAFRSDRDGDNAIFILDFGTMETRRLTRAELRVLQTNIDWGIEGRIAFAAEPDFDIGIYSLRPDGTGLTRITGTARRQGLLDAAWSPDGARLAYTSLRDDDLEVYSVRADGEGHLRLTDRPGPDASPAWSPDGLRLAFVSDRSGTRELYTMAADGGDVRVLTDGDGAQQPAWR